MMIRPFEKLDKEIASTVVFRCFVSIYTHFSFFPPPHRLKVFDSIKINFTKQRKKIFWH